MKLQKYSFGIGDRFAHQGKSQLQAIMRAQEQSIEITPVWNKSHREHSIIGTTPADVRKEADQAVDALKWNGPYYVDADHINMSNVDGFIEHSDFFTLDVADSIGKQTNDEDLKRFSDVALKYVGILNILDIEEQFEVTEDDIHKTGSRFLFAVQKAGCIYRHIAKTRGKNNFITEISMDESEVPQNPVEMFLILLMIAEEKIPAQTIAPKFTGRFNKGVDYTGDVAQFEKEFNQNIAVINFAVKQFGLPDNLKMSIHSGSDKFSIYEPINKALRKFNAGVHVKTAGTTWLEELIGLAEAGGQGLEIAKEIYKQSLTKFDELCRPYAAVIDIDKSRLPTPEEVCKWDGQAFASALRHDRSSPNYNPHFRQLLHVGYKTAARIGLRYTDALKKYEDAISGNVSENIYERHIRRIFLPGCSIEASP